ncbi:MAG: tyrosine-type recombinase/integrase [Myxococcales bacterium]|nr:tyrosine-type recombinase/integrase [Myxococcales bacterium]
MNRRLVNGDVRRLLGYSARKTYLALQRWCDAGLLLRKGAGTRPWYVAGEALVAGELVPRVPARPLVFPSRVGTYRGPEALLKPLAEAAQRARVGQRVTSQVLRRTFNTLMLKAGVDRTVVRSQMGHCSEAMTSRYAGVSVKEKREAVERLEE